MNAKRIIIADPELQYSLKLQLKFLQELQDAYEVDVITDEAFFEDCFSKPQNASCLIVNERWAAASLNKHNIEHIVVFTDSTAENDNRTHISRYASTAEIFNQIRSLLGDELETGVVQRKESKVIMFLSASGGTGKTVLSLALSEYLASKYYRVLYVNTQSVQSFQYYLRDQTPVSYTAAMTLFSGSQNEYQTLKTEIRKEQFSYLPPFAMPSFSYGITTDICTGFINGAKNSREYDFIVVDSGSDLDQETVAQVSLSDKVVLVTIPDRESMYALKIMLGQIRVKEDQSVKICNKVSTSPIKELFGEEASEIQECITKWPGNLDNVRIHVFSKSDDIKRLAFLVI